MWRTLSGPHPHPTSKHPRLLPGEWLKTQCWTCPLTSKDGLSRHSAPSCTAPRGAGGRRRPPREVWLGDASYRHPSSYVMLPLADCCFLPTQPCLRREPNSEAPRPLRKVLLGPLWPYLKWPRPRTGVS